MHRGVSLPNPQVIRWIDTARSKCGYHGSVWQGDDHRPWTSEAMLEVATRLHVTWMEFIQMLEGFLRFDNIAAYSGAHDFESWPRNIFNLFDGKLDSRDNRHEVMFRPLSAVRVECVDPGSIIRVQSRQEEGHHLLSRDWQWLVFLSLWCKHRRLTYEQ